MKHWLRRLRPSTLWRASRFSRNQRPLTVPTPASGPTWILATQPYWLADWIVNQLLGSTPDRSMSITSRMRSCSVWREKRAVPLELPFVFQWLDTL